jgi:hypothetical protein
MKRSWLALVAGLLALTSLSSAGPLGNVQFFSEASAFAAAGNPTTDADFDTSTTEGTIEVDASASDSDTTFNSDAKAETDFLDLGAQDILVLGVEANYDFLIGSTNGNANAYALATVTFDVLTLSDAFLFLETDGLAGEYGTVEYFASVDVLDTNLNDFVQLLYFDSPSNFGGTGPLLAGTYRLNVFAKTSVSTPRMMPVGYGEDGGAYARMVFGAQAVPEPATFAVLGLGALALLRRRKAA